MRNFGLVSPSILLGLSASLLCGQTYNFKVIQSFQPNGSNNAGALVGQAGVPIQGIYASGEFYITVTDPMLPKGGGNTELFGINDAGAIVGGSDVRGFVLKNGVFTTVAVPGSTNTFPYGINDAGVIVGGYYSGNTTMGFVLNGTKFQTFANPVVGINNHGDLLFGNGYLEVGGAITPIAFPGAVDTGVLGLNDNDSVVGIYTDAQSVSHGFVWSDGVYTSVDYPGAAFTNTQAIDNAGRVAGFALAAPGLMGFTAKPAH